MCHCPWRTIPAGYLRHVVSRPPHRCSVCHLGPIPLNETKHKQSGAGVTLVIDAGGRRQAHTANGRLSHRRRPATSCRPAPPAGHLFPNHPSLPASHLIPTNHSESRSPPTTPDQTHQTPPTSHSAEPGPKRRAQTRRHGTRRSIWARWTGCRAGRRGRRSGAWLRGGRFCRLRGVWLVSVALLWRGLSRAVLPVASPSPFPLECLQPPSFGLPFSPASIALRLQ